MARGSEPSAAARPEGRPAEAGTTLPRYFFFDALPADFLAAGFEVFRAVVDADFAAEPRFEPFEPDFDAPFLALDFLAPPFDDFAAALVPPFEALPPDFAALLRAPLIDFEAPFLVDFAPPLAELFAPPFEALPPDFAPDLPPLFEPLLEPEVFDDEPLLFALVLVEEVLESPMALPAVSVILVMADRAASVTLWAAPVIRFLATFTLSWVPTRSRRATLKVGWQAIRSVKFFRARDLKSAHFSTAIVIREYLGSQQRRENRVAHEFVSNQLRARTEGLGRMDSRFAALSRGVWNIGIHLWRLLADLRMTV
ncbi:MAG TPA: hypothetical protein VF744_21680 [Beijerinckiaceae bacterium]